MVLSIAGCSFPLFQDRLGCACGPVRSFRKRWLLSSRGGGEFGFVSSPLC